MDLTARLRDCFARQVELYEEILRDYGTLTEDLEGPDLGPLVERQVVYGRRARELAEELRVLHREWEASGLVSEGDRAMLAPHAARARALAQRLSDVHEGAIGRLGERMAEVRKSCEELRRGRDMLDKYRPTERTGGDIVDRQA
jgi:hypothetical protein